MTFRRVTLRVPSAHLRALAEFYGRRLGLPATVSADEVSVVIGETTLELVGSAGEPFYHFALLVPGNRFEAALAWAEAKTQLLPDSGSGEPVFHFDAWNAEACYFHDPAGNIVELIAHRGVGGTEARGDFQGSELLGFSELGLVGDARAMAAALARRLGLGLWDGTLDVPGGLAFIGEKARTLILAPVGRGWLPTGRAARRHRLEVVLTGAEEGDVELEGSRYCIRVSPR